MLLGLFGSGGLSRHLSADHKRNKFVILCPGRS